MQGKIYSMTNYFVVKEVNGQEVILTNQNGQNLRSNVTTVNQAMQSADQHSDEKKLNQTDLINIVLNNPRTAMSIYFQKANKNKTKKAYNEEMNNWAEKVKISLVNTGIAGSMKLLEAKPDTIIPGEMRLIKGYYTGSQDERGRLQFVDMEDSNIVKAVDPRTMEYVIVNNVKYIKK
jgi:hypothetical protein